MIRTSLFLVLAGLTVPLAAATQAQAREPLRCVDAQGKTTLAANDLHRLADAGVVQPVLVHRVDPQVDGKTLVPSHVLLYEALVDQEGHVCAARLLIGDETEESRSWLEAIRQWQYKPATLDGQPIAVFTIESIKPAAEDRPVQAPPQSPQPPQHPARSTADVAITPQQLMIANHVLPLPASHQELAAMLGAPTRAEENPGNKDRLFVWDSLGLVVYESHATGKIDEIAFYLQSIADRDFSPRTLAGPLTVGGVKVDASSKLDAVGHEILRQGGKHVLRLAFGVWTLHYGSFDVTLEEIDSPTLQTVTVTMATPPGQ